MDVGSWDIDLAADRLELALPDGSVQIFSLAEARECVHTQDLSAVVEAIDDLQSRRRPAVHVRFRLQSSPLAWRWIAAEGRMQPASPGLARLSGTWRDITSAQAAEGRDRQAVARMMQFAAAASHDIQGPLRHIALYAEMLEAELSGRLEAEQAEMLAALNERPRHLQAVVKRLFSFATGAVAPAIEAVAADKAFDAALALLHDDIARRQAEFDVADLPMVRADPLMLQSVLAAVIRNGLVFGRLPARLRVSGRLGEGRAEIVIADNGRGIEPIHQDRIFDAFWGLPPENGQRGPGLGLALAKMLLQAMDGDIVLAQSDDQGSTFVIDLPAA